MRAGVRRPIHNSTPLNAGNTVPISRIVTATMLIRLANAPELPIVLRPTCSITSAQMASGSRRVSASQLLVLNR